MKHESAKICPVNSYLTHKIKSSLNATLVSLMTEYIRVPIMRRKRSYNLKLNTKTTIEQNRTSYFPREGKRICPNSKVKRSDWKQTSEISQISAKKEISKYIDQHLKYQTQPH